MDDVAGLLGDADPLEIRVQLGVTCTGSADEHQERDRGGASCFQCADRALDDARVVRELVLRDSPTLPCLSERSSDVLHQGKRRLVRLDLRRRAADTLERVEASAVVRKASRGRAHHVNCSQTGLPGAYGAKRRSRHVRERSWPAGRTIERPDGRGFRPIGGFCRPNGRLERAGNTSGDPPAGLGVRRPAWASAGGLGRPPAPRSPWSVGGLGRRAGDRNPSLPAPGSL
jgi:hypothetical protein